jgi:hypothetical protein
MSSIHYVALTNLGYYWTGYNSVSSQIREARMYNSAKAVRDNVTSGIKRYNQKRPENERITSYQIVEVEIKTRSTFETIEI